MDGSTGHGWRPMRQFGSFRSITESLPMSNDLIQIQTKKILARMARDQGIPGWHAMRKDQLIRALTCSTSGESSSPDAGSLKTFKKSANAFSGNGKPIDHSNSLTDRLAMRPWHGRIQNHGTRDRVLAVARDPYWIHIYWELCNTTLERARAAMGQLWHGSKPILRVMDVTSEETSAMSERHERDECIQSDVNNWYINVTHPGRKYRVDLGFMTRRGSFFIVGKSNVVTMPPITMSTSIEEDWHIAQEEIHRIQVRQNDPESRQLSNELIELFEDRFHQPIHKTAFTHLPSNFLTNMDTPLKFEIGAELVIFGTTNPTSKVTLQGEPVPIQPDGSFSVRFHMPDSRQIIPAVACSADGSEEKTIILAVERNTKVMEQQTHDNCDF